VAAEEALIRWSPKPPRVVRHRRLRQTEPRGYRGLRVTVREKRRDVLARGIVPPAWTEIACHRNTCSHRGRTESPAPGLYSAAAPAVRDGVIGNTPDSGSGIWGSSPCPGVEGPAPYASGELAVLLGAAWRDEDRSPRNPLGDAGAKPRVPVHA